MSEYAIQYQAWALWGQAGATIAIAWFAGSTWLATRAMGKATDIYARVAGLSLIEKAVGVYVGGVHAPRELYAKLLQVLKDDFPKEWEVLKEKVPAELK